MIDEKTKWETCLLPGFVLIYNEENKEAGIYALVWALLINSGVGQPLLMKKATRWLIVRSPYLEFPYKAEKWAGICWHLTRQSEMTIDLKQVAKATICTPLNNGEIKEISEVKVQLQSIWISNVSTAAVIFWKSDNSSQIWPRPMRIRNSLPKH